MRIQDVRSLLFSKLNADASATAEEKLIKIKHYDDFALKTFINGLTYNMQLVVRLRQPDSLERALAYVKEEENFVYFKTGQNNNLLNSTYKPQPRINSHYQSPVTLNKFPQTNTQTARPMPPPNQNTRPFMFRQPYHGFGFQNNPMNTARYYQHPQPPRPMPWQVNNRFPTQQHPYFNIQRNSAIIRNRLSQQNAQK